MVATVRCEEIAGEKLKCFTTDEGWLKMKEAVQAGPVSGFGRAVSFILKPIFQNAAIQQSEWNASKFREKLI